MQLQTLHHRPIRQSPSLLHAARGISTIFRQHPRIHKHTNAWWSLQRQLFVRSQIKPSTQVECQVEGVFFWEKNSRKNEGAKFTNSTPSASAAGDAGGVAIGGAGSSHSGLRPAARGVANRGAGSTNSPACGRRSSPLSRRRCRV